MKTKIMFIAYIFISVSSAFAQKRMVENAIKEVALVPSKSSKALNDQKGCDVINKSSDRTITVRVEETTLINNILQKKIIAIEKIGPKEQKFVGYAGCDANLLYEKCTGFKIAIAYYDDGTPVTPTDKVANSIIIVDDKALTVK